MVRAIALSVVLALGLAVVASAVAPRPLQAQERLAPNPDIEAVIGGQFDAFRSDDLMGAWQFASPGIQSMFGEPERFGMMVEQAFPMVWEPGAVTFIDLQSLGSLIVQRVEVIDRNGVAHYLGYAMIQTENGWRISGVEILDAPGIGV
ncbi:DUF4864 domain-containing protein [Rhodobacterales bacterium HKCCE4037]|nr:DUF4864 domain-containing protein [Rhodobacterales bacterium HKCCE4037]